MNRQRIKRNFYRYPKYYHTALRFVVEIHRAPRPAGVDPYVLYKTQRNYTMDTYYNVYDDGKRKKKIPIQVIMPITSKDRNDLKVIVPQKYWPYRARIRGELLTYYRSLREEKDASHVA